ncbi:MAG: right-handed parallel beta-helix repeat-containing protein [Sphingobium sp.]
MAILTVNSSQAFTNAVSSARDGDVIKLAPGTYSNILIKNASFNSGITITSADPNNPAVLTDLTVRASSGLTFSSLDLYNRYDQNLAFQFMGSSKLVLDNLNVYGSGNSASAMNAQLMIIRESSNIVVQNSDFGFGWHGLNLFNTTSANVVNNFFHDLRTDGVRGGGNSNLLIKGNAFTDFYPIGNDHPDAIQLWTTNTSGSAANITIEGNVVFRGNGGPTQGVFVRDVGGSLPFQNMVVTNNLIAGGIFNGIALSGVQNGYLTNNIVQGYTDQRSGIQMQNSSNVIVSGNEASRYFGGLYGLEGQNGNVLIPEGTDGGVAIVNHWLSQNAQFVSAWSAIDPNVLAEIAWNGAPATSSSGTGSSYPFPTVVDIPPVSGSGDDTGSGSPTGGSTSSPDTDDDHGSAGADSGTPGSSIDGNNWNNRLIGTDGDDQINGYGGNDVITGADGDDTIYGGSGNDSIHGEAGNDTLYGESGGDHLQGYDGDDIIDGGAGRDTIDGGRGSDLLTGGSGDDIFRFRSFDVNKGDHDVITDFQRGVDSIMITSAQFTAGGRGDQVFHFIGQSAFHKAAGEIRFVDSAAGVTVQTDVNGDGVSDFEFSLRGVHNLSANDFIL